jgi:hypothetical protein
MIAVATEAPLSHLKNYHPRNSNNLTSNQPGAAPDARGRDQAPVAVTAPIEGQLAEKLHGDALSLPSSVGLTGGDQKRVSVVVIVAGAETAKVAGSVSVPGSL